REGAVGGGSSSGSSRRRMTPRYSRYHPPSKIPTRAHLAQAHIPKLLRARGRKRHPNPGGGEQSEDEALPRFGPLALGGLVGACRP
ncbi:unnamed protein product, partial [Pylaiella littoralis]